MAREQRREAEASRAYLQGSAAAASLHGAGNMVQVELPEILRRRCRFDQEENPIEGQKRERERERERVG
jgi:hypothetical protein